MSSSEKFTCKGRDFAAGFYMSGTPFLLMTPYLPPLHTQGKGGGELTREKVRGATVHKAGTKIPT
jgi:hypothetical protein